MAMEVIAECIATREEEQAVSTVAAGPRRSKVYDRRPDATDRADAVALKAVTGGASLEEEGTQ